MAVTAWVLDLLMPQCPVTLSVYQAALVRHAVRMVVVEIVAYAAQTRCVQTDNVRTMPLTVVKASVLKAAVMEIR